MRTLHRLCRQFLLRVLVGIFVLLTVGNLFLIPHLNPSEDQKAAREERRARIMRRQQRRIDLWRAQQARLEQGKRFPAATAEKYLCEEDALPPGSFHIIVAAWKYQQLEGNTGFEPGVNYLVDLGLPNAQIFWYRRMELHKEARNYTSSCNASVQEVLTPNIGRDALPFFHHILDTWENPPKAIVMLHGHVASSDHSSCQGVFARTIYYYRSLVRNASASKPMLTLISDRSGTKYFDHKQWWHNYEHLQKNSNATRLLKKRADTIVTGKDHAFDSRRRLNSDNAIPLRNPDNPCTPFLARWKDLIDLQRSKGAGKHPTCCGTFIVPWNRIQRFPKEFYEDIVRNVMLDANYSDYWKGRDCYEDIVWSWFGDYSDDFTDGELTNFYLQADRLINGGVVEQGPALHFRTQRCFAASFLPVGESGWLIWLNAWLVRFGLL